MTAARCPACRKDHSAGTTCFEGREAAWAIVKDRDVRDRFGRHYRWARAYLGLDAEGAK